jgi:hypothetical protein
MKTAIKRSFPLKGLTLALMSAVGVSLALTWTAQPAKAQLSPADDLNNNPQSGDTSSDPFSGTGSGQVNTMFDLIHRAQLGSFQGVSEFQQNQRQTISSEAENFRALQLQRIQQQTEPGTVNPEPSSSPETPAESN